MRASLRCASARLASFGSRVRSSTAASAFCASSSVGWSCVRGSSPVLITTSPPATGAPAGALAPVRSHSGIGMPASVNASASVSSCFATLSLTSGVRRAMTAARSCDSARRRAFSSSLGFGAAAVAPDAPGDSVADDIGPAGCAGSPSGRSGVLVRLDPFPFAAPSRGARIPISKGLRCSASFGARL